MELDPNPAVELLPLLLLAPVLLELHPELGAELKASPSIQLVGLGLKTSVLDEAAW